MQAAEATVSACHTLGSASSGSQAFALTLLGDMRLHLGELSGAQLALQHAIQLSTGGSGAGGSMGGAGLSSPSSPSIVELAAVRHAPPHEPIDPTGFVRGSSERASNSTATADGSEAALAGGGDRGGDRRRPLDLQVFDGRGADDDEVIAVCNSAAAAATAPHAAAAAQPPPPPPVATGDSLALVHLGQHHVLLTPAPVRGPSRRPPTPPRPPSDPSTRPRRRSRLAPLAAR